MMASEQKKSPSWTAGLYLAVLPKYRTACMSLLREEFGDRIIAWVSDGHLDASVRSDLSVPWYTRVSMRRVGRLGFLQTGRLRAAIKVDVLIVDLNPRSISAWILLVARRTLRRRTLVWGHLYPQAGPGSRTGGLRLRMRRLANGTITYTFEHARLAKTDLPNQSVWVAPNAIYRRSDIDPGEEIGARQNVVYVGRLVEGKKVALLLDAFAILARTDPDVRLTFVGGGDQEGALRAAAETLGIADRVTFAGWVSSPDKLQKIYAGSFASASPGFLGLGLTQSLGFGVPMAVSRDELHSPEIELARPGSVEWFETDSASELASTLQSLKGRSHKLPLREESERVRRTYSAESMADGLRRAILDITEETVPPQESNLAGRTGLPPLLTSLVRIIARRLAVHENVTYGSSFRVGRGCVVSSPHGLQIGHRVSIGPRTIVQVDGTIGSFSLIGMGVQIVGRNDHAIDEVGVPTVFSTWAGDRSPEPNDYVHIERDVWIGGSSVVLSGVRIGEGSIIGSGSVVTKDIPPYSIAVGNPARVVKARFESEDDRVAHSENLDRLEAGIKGARS